MKCPEAMNTEIHEKEGLAHRNIHHCMKNEQYLKYISSR